MKLLLELPVNDVFDSLVLVPVTQPVTVKRALEYLMFMQAISEDLRANGNQPNMIMLERIEEVAKDHGGLVIHDLAEIQDGTLVEKMLHNSTESMLFTRLAYLTSSLLAEDHEK